jgi:SynChlorMet cassette radical SAM/SPASM protein ScmF
MSLHEPQTADYPLELIYFYLTEGCNLRCRHCWIMSEENSTRSRNAILDVGLFESILAQARPLGLKAIKLTGGEPFLHPQIHHFLEIIQAAELRPLVETNGVLVTPELADLLACCHKPFVSVSLDGTDSATHEWVRQVPGSHRAAIQGIRYLVQAGLKPQIIFTIMRRNQDQIASIVQLAQELGAGSLKFNVVQPSPRGDRMREENETLTIKDLVKLGSWVERELAPTVDLTLHYSHPPAFRPLNRMFGQKGSGFEICGILGIIGVLANGCYALCGIGENIPELVFGHAGQDSLAELWGTHPVLQEIREGLPARLSGICQACLVRGCCLGYCLAQNYYKGKDLWSPFWFCEEAEAAGLFPASRKRPQPQASVSQGLRS